MRLVGVELWRQIFSAFLSEPTKWTTFAWVCGGFQRMAGLPKILLYDNLKSAVLEQGVAHSDSYPTLYCHLSAHYRFEPWPRLWPERNEKGRSGTRHSLYSG